VSQEATTLPETDEQSLNARAALELAVSWLLELLKTCPTLDLLAHFAFSENFADSESYSEDSSTRTPAFIEYLTLLALTRPSSAGTPPFPNLDMADVHNKVAEVFRLAGQLPMVVNEEGVDDPARLGWPAIMLRIHSTHTRTPGYLRHRDGMLDGLLGVESISSWMSTNLGFAYGDARAVNKAVFSLLNERLAARVSSVRAFVEAHRAAVVRFRRTQVIDQRLDEKLVRSWARLTPGKLKNAIRERSRQLVFGNYGQMSRFTAQAIAERTALSLPVVASYLRARQIDFGSVPPAFSTPAIRDDLLLRPFVHESGQYLVTTPWALDWGLRPFVESALNPSASRAINLGEDAWTVYKDNRADWLERTAASCFARLFPEARVERNLSYRIRTAGHTLEGELDVLVCWGPVVLLEEAKSAGLSTAARGGNLRILRDTLVNSIGKAQAQTGRVKASLLAGTPIVLKRQDGPRVELAGTGLEYCESITITLEDMAPFSTWLTHIVSANILRPEDLPWLVSVYDLQVIAELTSTPSQFLHFLQKRLQLSRAGRVTAATELDFWGLHLDRSLRLDLDRMREADFIDIGGHTEAIEHFYYHLEGWRRAKTPRPTWHLGGFAQRVLETLDRSESGRFASAAARLAELSEASHDELKTMVEWHMAKAREKGVARGCHTTIEGDASTMWAYVCSGAGPTPEEELEFLNRSDRRSAVRCICIAVNGNGTPVRATEYEIASDGAWHRSAQAQPRLRELAS